MVEHVADWVTPFIRIQHTPPPPLIFLHARELRAGELGLGQGRIYRNFMGGPNPLQVKFLEY